MFLCTQPVESKDRTTVRESVREGPLRTIQLYAVLILTPQVLLGLTLVLVLQQWS